MIKTIKNQGLKSQVLSACNSPKNLSCHQKPSTTLNYRASKFQMWNKIFNRSIKPKV